MEWNGDSWEAVGQGVDGRVTELAFHPSGDLYAVGRFDSIKDDGPHGLARWDGRSWSTVPTGSNRAVDAIVIDGNGNAYIAGNENSASNYWVGRWVARWDGQWQALGTGLLGPIYCLAADEQGDVYAGGRFTDSTYARSYYLARWNSDLWHEVPGGPNGEVYSLSIDSTGKLYVGGDFSVAGGKVCSHLALCETLKQSHTRGREDLAHAGTSRTYFPDGNRMVLVLRDPAVVGYSVFGLNGRELHREATRQLSRGAHDLDLVGLPAGLYNVLLNIDGNQESIPYLACR